MTFPKDFTWGAATSAYQIEGAVNQGGRGPSIWDDFCTQPGRIADGESGLIACDHYHRWKDDVGLMQELSLNAYRFSLAWPRILPQGDGKPNPEGLAFYDKLIDTLLEVGIKPWLTLFHWDLPLSLQERYGGWRSRETLERFADYAALCGQHFGDRVKNWFTINEILCFTILAHDTDRFAPGGLLPKKEVNQTVHHALIAHGMAASVLKKTVPGCKVGLVENLAALWPLWEDEQQIKAARTAFETLNSQRLFPSLTGQYNIKAYQSIYGDMPDIAQTDMETIGFPVDFIAFNYYHGDPVIDMSQPPGYKLVDLPPDYPKTDMGWGITPTGLYWSLRFLNDFFPDKPIYITESGLATRDIEQRDGTVMDLGRLEYYRRHLELCSRAIAEGVNLKGYFAWSLMDNFEWADGYAKRFGLIRVNYRTQQRTIKASGRYYAQVIRAGRVL